MSKFGSTKPSQLAYIATAAVVTVSTASFFEVLPHTFFIEKYRKIIAKYKRDVEVPLPKNVEKLYKQVLDDLEMDEDLRETYTPFTITGFDTYNIGLHNNRYGVAIGIPSHFEYKDKRSVDILQIRVGFNKEPLNPYHPATDDLIESLVLSDNAKKFGIAREILMSQKNLPLWRSCESPLIISTTAMAADMLRAQYNLFQKPFSMIVCTYLGLGFMSFCTWFQIRDSLNTFFEKRVDNQLASLGPNYVEGGKEFYDKLLKRNVAIRKLLGADGKKQYNADGDEIFFIRHKRTPLTHRKQFFEEYKETVSVDQPQAA